jgi:hypothetical protein
MGGNWRKGFYRFNLHFLIVLCKALWIFLEIKSFLLGLNLLLSD